MVAALWSALSDPTRRSVLDLLRDGPQTVGQLVDALGVTQPTTSKHLRVLRDVGFVQVTGDGQRRIYSIDPAPLVELDAWLDPYRRLWVEPLEDLSHHLDATEDR